ncbi:MAG TPA: response regulator [Beijerinckiaceae bacterium]
MHIPPLIKGVVILLAEDEMLVRMAATDILQEAGYHVLEARDGVEALAVLEIRDDVAALVTDVAMPNMNGVALAKIVSERWPHVGIIITSGAMPEGVELELPKRARFLPKPYIEPRLVQEIESVLPRVGGPVALKSLPTIPAGREFGAGGLAHPLSEPDQS